MKKRLLIVLLTGLIPSLGACNNGGSSSTTAPVAPTVTETFSGVVPVLGSSPNNFTVTQANSTVTVTLASAGPPATISMGVAIGNGGSGGACSFASTSVYYPVVAGTTAQVSGTLTSAGTYCVDVLDEGNESVPVTYTIFVAHS